MAMFFDFPVAAPSSYTPLTTSWHPVQPLLAVAARERLGGAASGAVHVFSQDGEPLEGCSLQRAEEPSCLAWHPTNALLVAGWASGELVAFNASNKTAAEPQRVHHAAVKCIIWADDGTCALTADEHGVIGLWRATKAGQLKLSSETRIEAGVTQGVAWRPEDSDTCYFFLATTEDDIIVCDSYGTTKTGVSSEHRIVRLLLGQQDDSLFVFDASLMITRHHINDDGSLSDASPFKISGNEALDMTWTTDNVLALCTGENAIRLVDVEEGSGYVLGLADKKGDFSTKDILQTASYNKQRKLLAVGSNKGLVFMWKLKGGDDTEGASQWQFLQPTDLSQQISSVQWMKGQPLLAVQGTSSDVWVLREHIMRKAFAAGLAAVQVSSTRLVIEKQGRPPHAQDIDFPIRGIAVDVDTVAVWGSKNVAVFELLQDGTVLRPAGSFKRQCTACAVRSGMIFSASGSIVTVSDFNGRVSNTITLDESEGNVTLLSCNGPHVAAVTDSASIRTWSIHNGEARPQAGPRSFADDVDAVTDLSINCDGTMISFLAEVGGARDASLWTWRPASNMLTTHAFGLSGRLPTAQFWDDSDTRLLTCEVAMKDADDVREVTSLFATPDRGLVVHHTFPLTSDDGPLIGVRVPYLCFARRGRDEDGHVLTTKPMRDFAGLEDADNTTRVAMLEFSYQLTIGNLDEAFKSVRLVQNPNVWRSMARMCVGTKRVDVGLVCLGKMGNIGATRAVRKALDKYGNDAGVAMLSIQLGMEEEAIALYKEIGRFDLLNKHLQATGNWAAASQTSRTNDRVHLRNTAYSHAQALESLDKVDQAIEEYEKAGTAHSDVPRMLLNENLPKLSSYVSSSNDKRLLKWWAQYSESAGDVDAALKAYADASDTLSLVRVYCYCDNIDNAKALVETTKDKAGAYYLAKHLEGQGNTEEAIDYYTKAESFSNALRLARDHNMSANVLSLALRASKSDMLSAAQYYEQQGLPQKAVMLYHKAGRVSKAVQMCFDKSLFQELATISQDLDEHTDPALLQRAANFFMEHGQNERAVGLLVAARRFDDALTLCEKNNVFLTEEYAERMSPAKEEMDKKQRADLLVRIGDIASKQGSYQLATKKYTQAGERTKAMEALLRSGDISRIVFFAERCNLKNIYVMAANYLQNQDWRQDPDIMKHIITFYTKGKALDSLSSFYEACSEVEIEEYQNYEKALEALEEALRCISKARMKDRGAQEARVSSLQNKIAFVKQFLELDQIAAEDPAEMISKAREMLEEQELDTVIPYGDVYGKMIDYHYKKSNYQEAYELMQELRERIPNVNVAYYATMEVVQKVHEALQIPLGTGQGPAVDDGDDVAEEIEDADV